MDRTHVALILLYYYTAMTTTTTTSTTTPLGFAVPSTFFQGNKDAYTSFSSFSSNFVIESSISPSYFFGGLHEQFQIYSGGYLTFDTDNFYQRNTPIASRSAWTISYVAPFWTQTTFSPSLTSAIGFGEYLSSTDSPDLFNSIQTEIRTSLISANFVPQAIYTISWINLVPTSAPNQVRNNFLVFTNL